MRRRLSVRSDSLWARLWCHGLGCLLILATVLLARSGSVASGQDADFPRASEVVKPLAHVPARPVPRACKFEVAVVAKILPGFHINAHKVLQDYLIPTTLQPDLPAGVRLMETRYPPGELKKFGFSEEKLNVYEGTVVLRMKLQAAPEAPLGAMKIPLRLRYQPCNDELCLPPVTLPLEAQAEITRVTTGNCFLRAEIR